MKILLIDDHPMVLDSYENMLARDFSRNYPQTIHRGSNCEEAHKIVLSATKSKSQFHLAIIDHSLPPYQDLKSGTEVAHLVKTHNPHCKIIIITSHVEMLIVYDIIKKVSPDGIAIKNDVSSSSFQIMVQSVLDGEIYQSPLVINYIADIWKNKLMAEESNRQILLHLSNGYRVKDLEEVTNLKSRAIEKRMKEIRNLFMAKDNSALLIAARREGYI